MNEQYVRKCCLDYAENRARLVELNAQLTNYGRLTQNFGAEGKGYDPLNKEEKGFILREKLREQRDLVIKQIQVANAVANLYPVIHMTTREGMSIRRYAEVYKTTHYDARKQFDRAITDYVQSANGRVSKC